MALLPKIKLKAVVSFPAAVLDGTGIDVVKANGTYQFNLDFGDFAPPVNILAPNQNALLWNANTNQYSLVPVALFAGGGGSLIVVHHITVPGPITIASDTTIVQVDQSVGAPITLIMGLASARTVPVLIADWKGDAGTNNITITLSGTDKFPGGLTSWKIASDTGSVFLRPISGGYIL